MDLFPNAWSTVSDVFAKPALDKYVSDRYSLASTMAVIPKAQGHDLAQLQAYEHIIKKFLVTPEAKVWPQGSLSLKLEYYDLNLDKGSGLAKISFSIASVLQRPILVLATSGKAHVSREDGNYSVFQATDASGLALAVSGKLEAQKSHLALADAKEISALELALVWPDYLTPERIPYFIRQSRNLNRS